jgi:Sec-independent protein translocase protein TatA
MLLEHKFYLRSVVLLQQELSKYFYCLFDNNITMLNFSWGELIVVTGLGLAFIGRQDLPKAAHMVGTQLGRMVGLLQGARARADRYAAHSELRQLQNELRSGLRELDAVKSEMAVSLSPMGMMGRTLGPLTANADTRGATPMWTQNTTTLAQSLSAPVSPTNSLAGGSSTSNSAFPSSHISADAATLSSSSTFQSTAAVAEQEWAKQGMAFTSAAERGAAPNADPTGSQVLAKLLQESLIFDQYDRVAAEQNALLQTKVHQIQANVQEQQQQHLEAATCTATTAATEPVTASVNKTKN